MQAKSQQSTGQSGILLLVLVVFITSLCAPQSVWARQLNTLARQSQNEGMQAVPAPSQVIIDGDLREWDWSGRIWSFADWNLRDEYSVETAAMWDDHYLYVAAKWRDQSPLNSALDPLINPKDGWKADSLQIRMRTDHNLWLTMWHFAKRRISVLQLADWKKESSAGGVDTRTMETSPGMVDLGQGAQIAYKRNPDGQGFTQELRLPWQLIYRGKPAIEPGKTLRFGLEFLWADQTGLATAHRYADNLQPGRTSREFFWSAYDVWGDLVLSPHGDLKSREYAVDFSKGSGIPVRICVPGGHRMFTVVVDTRDGARVRTLVAGQPIDEYVVGKADKDKTTVEVPWDGRDDFGKAVSPGQYQLKGIVHDGVELTYDCCFYNPGCPPWRTADGSGAWGADHNGPQTVARSGQWMGLGFGYAEGGSGIIGVDAEGLKRWGDRRGAVKLAGDDEFIYAYVKLWYTPEVLCRFEAKTGRPAPFVQDGKLLPFDLPVKTIAGQGCEVTGLAAHDGKLAVAFESRGVLVLDARCAKLLEELPVKNVSDLAYDNRGNLYALRAGQVGRLGPAGSFIPIPLPGATPTAMTLDRAGNILVFDNGQDCQIKAFSASGKLVYTLGQKQGRPLVGRFNEQGMVKVSSLAEDWSGQVWATENWQFPRRVSVWKRDHGLVKQYVGNANYAGSGCFLHDQIPELGYFGPVEMKLDRQNDQYSVSEILWLPQKMISKDVLYSRSQYSPQRFSSSVAGLRREYMYIHDPDLERGLGHVVLMKEDSGAWRAVACISLAGQLSGKIDRRSHLQIEAPSGELAGLNAFDLVVWNDLNKNGRLEANEYSVVRTGKPGSDKARGEPAMPLTNGWGGRLGEDLSVYTAGIFRWKPLRYDQDGAPFYSLGTRTKVQSVDAAVCDLVPVPSTNKLVCLSWAGKDQRLAVFDVDSGKIQWSYPNPYPGVHGSHDAPMPQAGVLLGPLKICGTAKVNDSVGQVFLVRGNLGQDYIFTLDGLYVCTLFRDGRLPAKVLPETEAQMRKLDVTDFTQWQEPFGGWFGKQDDGKVRLTSALAREACVILEVSGLDSILRFDAGQVSLSQSQVAAGNGGQADLESLKAYLIRRVGKPPVIDGKVADWQRIPARKLSKVGQPESASVRMCWDAKKLYFLYEVNDPSPWRNEGENPARLFKTGDACDFQLSTDTKPHNEPGASDRRVVFSQLEGEPVAILMVPKDRTARGKDVTYTSAVGSKRFDRVERLDQAQVRVTVVPRGYVLEAAVPLEALGLSGNTTRARGDFGIISSDAPGKSSVGRLYWSNKRTNLVSDEPLESWLFPNSWGEFIFQ